MKPRALVVAGVLALASGAYSSLGLLISTRARTQMEAQQMGQLLFLPGIFRSGYMFRSKGCRPYYARSVSCSPSRI